MVKITNEMRKNVFIRYFWLNMRNLMMKKLTIQKIFGIIYICSREKHDFAVQNDECFAPLELKLCI